MVYVCMYVASYVKPNLLKHLYCLHYGETQFSLSINIIISTVSEQQVTKVVWLFVKMFIDAWGPFHHTDIGLYK